MTETPTPAPTPAEPEPVADTAEAAAKPAKAPAKRAPAAVVSSVSPRHVVGGGAQDDVSLAACVFKNKFVRKSLSVHHLQRRLSELGFTEAYADRDGFYGDLTRSSVRLFQESQDLPGDGLMTVETLAAIFEGDSNVRLVS